jgi:hypothetical protein
VDKFMQPSGAMTEIGSSELKTAVESQHGGTAHYAQSVPVREKIQGEHVWEGTVAIFDLKSSPSGCNRAYAWSYELEGGKRRFFAMLHIGPVDSPVAAVRAAVGAEARANE